MNAGLGPFIRRCRESIGLTQDELATRIGTSRAYMSQVESGRAKWPQSLVPALAKALHVSQAELALAAGIITEATIAREEPFPHGDVRRKILAMLSELRDDDAEFVRIVVEAAVERRRSIGAKEIVTESREATETGAVGMAERQMRRLPAEADEDEPVTFLV